MVKAKCRDLPEQVNYGRNDMRQTWCLFLTMVGVELFVFVVFYFY